MISDQQRIIEELSKQKEELINIIENVRNEIYDSLDDILQNHINSLDEKLLETKNNDDARFVNIFSSLSRDMRKTLFELGEDMKYKVDINVFDEKINNIIEAFSQLESEFICKTESNDCKGKYFY